MVQQKSSSKKKPGKKSIDPSKYIAKKDRGCYHVEIEQKAFETQTGEKLSKPSVQIFTPKNWNHFKENAKRLGWSYVILHDPSKN